MKKACQHIVMSILGVLICVSLSGCTIGEYHVFDVFMDENGEQRFMIFGEIGPSGGGESIESIESENSAEEADDMQENENSAERVDDMQENENSVEGVSDMQENENSAAEGVNDAQENEINYDPESIVGTSLKRGWISSDHSILKGRNVSVKEDSTLFSINLGQEKEVTISYDIVLDEGEYQLVYVSPDGTEQILQDSKVIQPEEKILFAQGQNEISILSSNAVFKEIDISIVGIQVSDFE